MTKRWLMAAGVFGVLGVAAPAAQGQGLSDFDYENLSFRGLGLEAGFLAPNKLETTTSLNLRLDLGFLGPNFRIAPTMSYWRSDFKAAEVAELEDRLQSLVRGVAPTAQAEVDLGVLEWSDLVIGLDGEYVWPVGTHVEVALGIGASTHFMNGEGAAIKDTFVEDLLDRVTVGGNVHLGTAFAIAPQFRVTGQFRYELLDDLSYPELRFGGLFVFGGRRDP